MENSGEGKLAMDTSFMSSSFICLMRLTSSFANSLSSSSVSTTTAAGVGVGMTGDFTTGFSHVFNSLCAPLLYFPSVAVRIRSVTFRFELRFSFFLFLFACLFRHQVNQWGLSLTGFRGWLPPLIRCRYFQTYLQPCV